MKKHLFLLTFLAASVTGFETANAQDTAKPADAQVRLGDAQWKPLLGVFVSQQNPDMKVQFTKGSQMLVGHLLWNNSEAHLVPTSPLTFTSKEAGDEGPLHLTFVRDENGEVNRLEVEKNGTWIRDKNFQPDPPKKEMAHTPDQLKPFEGIYQAQFNKDLFLRLMVKANNLVVNQEWDNTLVSFSPETESSFFAPSIPHFTLDFIKDSAGHVTRMLAFKRDVWLKAKAPQPLGPQEKALAGIYTSKDDPDNSIRLSVRDGQLVLTQLWDKKDIRLEALAADYFNDSAGTYSLHLISDEKGAITGVMLLGTDLFLKK